MLNEEQIKRLEEHEMWKANDFNKDEVVPELIETIKHLRSIANTAADIQEKLYKLRDLVWGEDIPSPTVPEYREHHESIQKILKFIDNELITR